VGNVHNSSSSIHGRRIVCGDGVPIDNLPERLNILGAAVLVAQVVRVLPHVKAKDRNTWFSDEASHERVLLVRKRRNKQLSILAVDREKSPTTTKALDCSVIKGLLHCIEFAKVGIDLGAKFRRRGGRRIRTQR
jgi:hypothetical protein